MKKLALLFLVLISVTCYGQDTIRIKHTNYTTIFSTKLKYPIEVSWWLTKSMVTCALPEKRNNTFCADPLLSSETNLSKDYVNSGFDKGHNCPADDNLCQTDLVQRECFYFSNMSPQYHKTNAGSWENLERLCRTLAKANDSIHVWCGSIGIAKRIGRVAVPAQQWKVIYIKKLKQYRAYIFNNSPTDDGNGKNGTEVTVSQITKLTNFRFR